MIVYCMVIYPSMDIDTELDLNRAFYSYDIKDIERARQECMKYNSTAINSKMVLMIRNYAA